MSAYLSVDIDRCRRSGHSFVVAGSDKSPMKRSLICRTCSEQNPGKTAYAAYGIDTSSWGQWRQTRKTEEQISEFDEVMS